MTYTFEKIKLADDYDTLAKQCRAMISVLASVEARLRFYEKEKQLEYWARLNIESERAANEVLTDEIDRLNKIIQDLKERR
jgi:hypothetical protein